jgi:TonB family protein
MNGVINFLLESGISLTVFSIIYVLFLRKETFFRMNRLFLLGAVLFSVILPLLKFRVIEQQSILLPEITVTPYRNLLESVTIYGQDLSASVENAVLSVRMLIWVYLAGVSLLMINYLIRLIRIVFLIQKNQVIKTGRINLVVLENECSPFSFYNHVFVSRQLRNMEGYDRMIRHEEEHIKQGHSFDILIIELLTVFQWFNPFIWMLGHAIRENHEYLADRAVLESGTDRGYYKKLLLSQIAGGQLALTNNFNYSLIKNRFKMMSKIKSSKIANIKVILGILAATALILVFACENKEESQSLDPTKNATIEENKIPEGEDIFFIVEKMPEFPGGEAALRQFIANNIVYPELAKDNGIQGKVYVTFVVSKDGSVANAEIARGVEPLLDKEALRVVNSLPAWSPGYQKGKPVNVQYTVPINFVLDGDDKKNTGLTSPQGKDVNGVEKVKVITYLPSTSADVRDK